MMAPRAVRLLTLRRRGVSTAEALNRHWMKVRRQVTLPQSVCLSSGRLCNGSKFSKNKGRANPRNPRPQKKLPVSDISKGGEERQIGSGKV